MRLTIVEYAMALAFTAASRGTCTRRKVGAIIMDAKGYVLSSGYNGVPSGTRHCADAQCVGATAASGQQLDSCMAIHAEINALMHCRDLHDAKYIFTTTQPCVACTKALLATNIKHIYYYFPYNREAAELWTNSGRYISAYEDNSQCKPISDVFTRITLDLPNDFTELDLGEDSSNRHRDL